jgi:hypothetical protein
MITSGRGENAALNKVLDEFAGGMQQLQSAGLVVMFRPVCEMNGYWFWWGNVSSQTFVKFWRYLFNYMTYTKGLNNLLWLWAPNDIGPDIRNFYPGDGYVDLVAPDVYNAIGAGGSFSTYDEAVGFGKPIGIGEFGYTVFPVANSYDYTNLIQAIHTSYPKVVWVNQWWGDFAIVRQNGGAAFMADPWMINRDGLNWQSGSPPPTPTPTPAPTPTPILSSLTDPGFELQIPNSPLGSPWSGEGPAKYGADVWSGTQTSTNGPHSGSKDGFIYSTGPVSWTDIIHQPVAVTPNTDYTLTGWFQNSNTTGFTGGNFGIRTASGAVIKQTAIPLTSTYTQLSVPFNSGGNTSVVVYGGYVPGNGFSWMHMDDLDLSVAGNLVHDPGFESQTGSPLVSPWAAQSDGSVFTGVDVWNGTQTNTNGPHSGSNDAFIYSNGPNPPATIIQTISVSPNTNYTLTGWVQNSNSAGFTNGLLGVRTTSGIVINQSPIPLTTTYTQVSVPFNSGANTSVVIFGGYTPGNDFSWMHLDDVSVQ